MIQILLNLVEFQLERGFSLVVDSVFMGEDRYQAQQIAHKHAAAFRPVYTYASDQAVWKERVCRRVETVPAEIKDQVATWERIQEQRKHFYPWKPQTALFVDGVHAIETNLDRVLAFITADSVSLERLQKTS
jgi:predicted kinase